MCPKQFQGEPIQCDVFEKCDRKLMEVAGQTTVDSAAMASLLLGISQRDWITETEKEMLDNLAPANSITFLIRGNSYLHPENVELFPLELIETTLAQQGTPVFTHRYQPSLEDRGNAYEIQTALICRIQSKPLILGFLKPEHNLFRQTGEDWFCNLATRFRDISVSLSDLNKQITEILTDTTPAIVINRSSGRILCINSCAVDIIGKNEQELIDQEFGQVKERLLKALHGRKLVARNINEAGLTLSIITLPVTVAKSESKDSFAGDFFVYRFRHRISNIMLAANLVESMIGDNLGEDGSTMIQTIIDEIKELDNYLTKLNLILNYNKLTAVSTNLVYELERATDLIDSKSEQTCSIDIRNNVNNPVITSHGAASICLFESILRAHMIDRSGSRTVATFDKSSADNRVSVRIETTASSTDKEARMDRFWNDYATRLCSQMGVSDFCTRLIKGSVIRTDFTIETNKSGARR